MRSLLSSCLCAALISFSSFGQTEPDHPASTPDQDNNAAPSNTGNNGEASRSTLDVKPGHPTLKPIDIERNRPIAPWKRLPVHILSDQKHIWTSPFHTAKSDVKWWLIFGGTAAVLIPLDKTLARQMPNTSQQTSIATWTSRLGAAYTLLPISAGFYFTGLGAKDERFRETGILGFEALANSTIIETIIKATTRRERPLEGNGNGAFWSSSSVLNSSFPSGHAINSFALASLVAHEYHDKKWVPIVAYGLAGTVVMSRFAARKHFPTDVVLGSAMGWFIGDYVYAKRHNNLVDEKQSALQKVLAHVRIGGESQLPPNALNPQLP